MAVNHYGRSSGLAATAAKFPHILIQRRLVSLRLVNPRLGLTMQMRYRQRELPGFVQWKQLGQGMYVLGLEPCSRRAADRPAVGTVELVPGAAINYWLEIGMNERESNQL